MTRDTTEFEPRSARRRRMVAEMSNIRTLKWVGVALLVHVLLIGGTSIPYMRGQGWLKWAGLKPLPEAPAQADAATPAQPPPAPAPDVPKTAASAPAAPAVKEQPSDTSAPRTDADALAELKKKGNPEAAKLTETAKPPALGDSLKPIDDLDAPKK